MELRKIMRTDIAASAIAHLTLVALIIVISEVRPFHSRPSETVTVDIVTPEQVKQEEVEAEETKEAARPPQPLPDLKLPKPDITDKAEATKPAAGPQPAAPPRSQQASPEPQQKQPQPSQAAKQRETNAQPQAAPPPAYQAPQPDVTIRYGVMLGLPPELPLGAKGAKDDGGDANASIAAKLPPEVIAELRRHLRTCAKLPAGVAPTDNVHVRLRTVFATDGTLAREPILIEAPPSAKGVAIVKSATSALQSCQPYKMLPANLYGEWKVLDLPFSPKDFGG